MNVRVLTGRTGRLLPIIIREIGEAIGTGDRLILLVPEQYTLQAELEIVRRLKLPGFITLEVLSPSRFTDRVFERAGAPSKTRISADGKCMAMQALLDSLSDSLIYYAKAAARRGFACKVADTIGDFKRAGITPDILSELAGGFDGALNAKLTDFERVWRAYESFMEGQFADGEDVQRALLERLPDSKYADGARIWVYGFDLITTQMGDMLCAAARLAKSFTLSLTWEREDAPDGALYEPARATLSRLARRFDIYGIIWNQLHVKSPLAATDSVRYLERSLFAKSARPYDRADGGVEIIEAETPYREAARAAARILTLTAPGAGSASKMKLDDIRVVHADLDSYGGCVAEVFERYGIPVYLDRKHSAAAHPFFRGILGALSFAAKGERTDFMMDWLKSGFSELETDEIWRLELYAKTHGIDGWKWSRAFDKGGAAGQGRALDEASLRAPVEPLRRLAAEPLYELRSSLRAAESSGSYARAMWEFTINAGLKERLGDMQADFSERAMPLESSHCGQVWKKWIDLLDQLDSLLARNRVTPALFASMVETGIRAMELAALPPENGRLIIGQIGRMKLGGVRAIFVMGLSDGAFASGGESLLTDMELNKAEQALDTPIGLDARTLLKLSQMNLLDVLSAPCEYLSVSCCLGASASGAGAASSVLLKLKRLLPNAIRSADTVDGRPVALYAPGSALDALGPLLQRGESLANDWRGAVAALNHMDGWRARLRRVLAAAYAERSRARISESTASALYSNAPYSVTRLERFAACPYSHFVRYGLYPKSVDEPGFVPNLSGTLLHLAFEEYLRMAALRADWPHQPQDQIAADMITIARPLVDSFNFGLARENALNAAVAKRLMRLLSAAANLAAYQMQASMFRPLAFETKFGLGDEPLMIPISNGDTARDTTHDAPELEPDLSEAPRTRPADHYIALQGRIDRIDLWDAPDGRYVRVIDYKSGSRARSSAKMDDTMFYYGLDIQLMLYLAAALNRLPGTKPAGAYLFKLDEPVILDDGQGDDAITKKRLNDLRMRGVTLADQRVVRAMDCDSPPRSMMKVYANSGDTLKISDAVSEEELTALMEFAVNKAAQLARGIESGTIAAEPCEIGAWNACMWCDYRALCRRDPRRPIKRLAKISRAELLKRIMDKYYLL
ncbi:MAG: PD-(D/E)XK nuclease family protein [Oscillospiraceae bacterium]|jgi:ATP-dependent helicase/nuclease subunit B|nr:PD-(D/E)XK nuclease family protein [Oscillospiraceae bacterium]